MLLLDHLKPDKGKQARLLTEHLRGQRILPYTEQELQKSLERKAEKAMAAALAARATHEEAIAAGQAAMEGATGARSSAHMLD